MNNIAIKKIIAIVSLVLIPSVIAILFFTASTFGVIMIFGDVDDFSDLYSKEATKSFYNTILFTLVITGSIGFGIGVILWKFIMKKTNLVTQDFINY
jgi:hypothetical protein